MTGIPMRRALLAVAASAALAVTGCGSDDEGGSTGASTSGGGGEAANTDVSGDLSVVGIWTGDEQKSFQAVLDGFTEQYPDVSVKYNPAGDNTPTVLSTAVEGGNPPDLAMVGQPGLVKQFADQGELKPLDFAKATLEENFPADIVELGTIDGKIYSFVFKAANKSTVWFNTKAFEDAGVEPPATWDEFITNADTLQASGVPAYSIAGADGWTLTDLFENIYLRQAGPEKYDQLSDHEIKWTDPSVKEALTTMGQVFENSDNIAGGTQGALETDFPTSVSNVLSDSPKAAQVIEGDFVPGVVASKTQVEPGTDFDVFAFPDVGDTTGAVVGGGDSLIMFKDSPAGQALVEYLASPEAAEIWAKRGGFSSANTQLPEDAYSDELTRTTATAIADAETFRFDMSDLAPAEFGGTPGQGEWKILQDFLANPDQVDQTASKLEKAAARAYGN
ncbi:MAG TPA: extracellular solute-binding protein [Capillimicrobium sp.]|jgi:ABC-type Fe3+ transport system substrate-binding protein